MVCLTCCHGANMDIKILLKKTYLAFLKCHFRLKLIKNKNKNPGQKF